VAVEILSVSLSEDSVSAIADRVAQLIGGVRAITESSHPSSETTQSAERSGFQQPADPWLDSPDAQPERHEPPATTEPAERHCRHGKMRYVKAGVSANGRKYNAFYGCPLERGNPDQCKPARP
jgi:hypothetical protein